MTNTIESAANRRSAGRRKPSTAKTSLFTPSATDIAYRHAFVVNHQGSVIVLARDLKSAQLYYEVQEPGMGEIPDVTSWTGFKLLPATTAVRPAGFSLAAIGNGETLVSVNPEAPFRAISDDRYLCVFQQTMSGTLLLNRFALRQTGGPGGVVQELVPALDVRFRRSGKSDVPASSDDSQGYQDPANRPFLEPAIDLPMVDLPVADPAKAPAGAFDVLILPDQEGARRLWQFVWRGLEGTLKLLAIPMDSNGLFALEGFTDAASITADSVIQLTWEKPEGKNIPVAGVPRAALYALHERTPGAGGDALALRRSARVLVAAPVKHPSSDKEAVVTIDFALGSDGRLAQAGAPKTVAKLPVQAVKPADMAMRFRRTSSLLLTPDTNGVILTDGFAIQFWLNLDARSGSDQYILGSGKEDGAPYVKVRPDLSLEVGFGSGNAKTWAGSRSGLIREGMWVHVRFTFKAGSFSLEINGHVAEIKQTGSRTRVDGAPITVISGAAGATRPGFAGVLSLLKIEDNSGKTLADWPLGTIDANRMTPDLTGRHNAMVRGAVLVPSTAPVAGGEAAAQVGGGRLMVATAGAGKLTQDSDGRTIHAGLLDFGVPMRRPSLLVGADGVVRLYFADNANKLSAAHLEAESARAVFSLGWTAGQGGPKGDLLLVAARAGRQMNRCCITVEADPQGSGVCKVKIDDGAGGTETWTGMPRSLRSFVKVVNGLITDDPRDPDLKAGRRAFFDVQGRTGICSLADDQGHTYGLLSKCPELMQVAKAQVTLDTKPGSCTLAVTCSLPAAKEEVTLTLSGLPACPADILTRFAGGFGAAGLSSKASAAYLLARDVARKRYAILYTRKDEDVKSITVKIKNGKTPETCACFVDVTYVSRMHHTESEQWEDIPRDKVIEKIAGSGKLQKYFTVLGSNGAWGLPNIEAKLPEMGAADWVSLLDLYPADAAASAGFALTAALKAQEVPCIVQKAVFSRGDLTKRGSRLFRAMDVTADDSHGALIDDRAAPGATMVQAAVTGGWVLQAARYAATFDGKRAVKAGNAGSGVLAGAGDRTVELWCCPESSGSVGEAERRLLTCHVSPPGADTVQCGLGLMPTAALKFSDTTLLTMDLSASPLAVSAMTCQIWIYLTGNTEGYLIILDSPIMEMELESNAYLRTSAGIMTQATKMTLEVGHWHQITARLKQVDGDRYEVTIFTNGVYIDRWNTAFNKQCPLYPLAKFMIGKGFGGQAYPTDKTLPMLVNGVFVWDRALSDDEIRARFTVAPPPDDPGLLIAWYLTEGSGITVTNRAVNGPQIVATIDHPPTDLWQKNGVFLKPYATAGGYGVAASQAPLLGGWRHLAASFRSAHALRLGGADFAHCGNDTSLDLGAAATVELWFRPAKIGLEQVLAGKKGSYELRLTASNCALLTVTLKDGSTRSVSAKIDKLAAGTAWYLAATVATGMVSQEAKPVGSSWAKADPPKYFVELALTVNDSPRVMMRIDTLDKLDAATVAATDAPLYLGCLEPGALGFCGDLAEVRLWNRVLEAKEITEAFIHRRPPAGGGLISYWRFAEAQGTVTSDEQQRNAATVSTPLLWRDFAPATSINLIIDGEEQTALEVLSPNVGGDGWGAKQITLGGLFPESGTLARPFAGQLAEVRIWDRQRSAIETAQGMNRRLAGDEDDLQAYWPLDDGSGVSVEDLGQQGIAGAWVLANGNPPPDDNGLWSVGGVPVGSEAPAVHVLGAPAPLFAAELEGIPAVVEYAESRRDARGRMTSILRRCYAMDRGGAVNLLTGYTVGELDTVYVGQVQTQPSLIGYIEGAPPVPSENQTRPWWTAPLESDTYTDTSRVRLTQAERTVRQFRASSASGSSVSDESLWALAWDIEFAMSAGLGAEAHEKIGGFEGDIGNKKEGVRDSTNEEELGFGFGYAATLTDQLSAGGEWEPPGDILNADVGRRFVPDNIGYALVKSLTADMYVAKLKGANTVVGTTLMPDPDIPADINILTFPIDPSYVKNGTLDGRVGLCNDPDYPNADLRPGSYFKPIEAYALKRSIEREEQQLEAYYAQFDPRTYASGQGYDSQPFDGGFDAFQGELAKGLSRDWARSLSRRSIANTYVWTAAGGLHTEQTEMLDTYGESFTGRASMESALGLHISAKLVFTLGGLHESDNLLGNSVELLATRSKESETSFGLEVDIEVEELLRKPEIDEKTGQPSGFGDANAPGKVDGYRFMSFFLAPSTRNFEAFSSVIDRAWLTNSSSPAAAALRTATEAVNGSWRVLHRVTYVSRVPPGEQHSPAESRPDPVTPPANQAANVSLIALVERALKPKAPTPQDIATAVNQVLDGEKGNAGSLAAHLAWWEAFKNKAQDPASVAASEMTTLRRDLLAYMRQFYAARAAALEGHELQALRRPGV